MQITFCLPQPGLNPIGGYKIIYEYANRLAKRGHQITIVYDCNKLFYKDKLDAVRYLKILIKYNRNKHWFILEKKIKIKYALHGINNKVFPQADCVVASAIETIEAIYNLSEGKGKKIYFVQDIENWRLGDEYVNNTYAYPICKIAISDWIKERVDQFSPVPTVVIPNGLDFNIWALKIPVSKRNKFSVAMLYHALEHKGSSYGIEALIKLKEKVPQLTVEMFGAPERPEGLPEWINYTRRASQEQVLEIYNKSSIFLCPTIEEGFGLTGAESMACGCALVSTDYMGAKVYAENNRNALICPIRDSEALCKAMETLINDNDLRIKIAGQGLEDIKKIDWNNSVTKFEGVLLKTLEA